MSKTPLDKNPQALDLSVDQRIVRCRHPLLRQALEFQPPRSRDKATGQKSGKTAKIGVLQRILLQCQVWGLPANLVS